MPDPAETVVIELGDQRVAFRAERPDVRAVLARHFAHCSAVSGTADVQVHLTTLRVALPSRRAGVPYRLERAEGGFDFGPGLVWGGVDDAGSVTATLPEALLDPSNIFLFDRFLCHLLFTSCAPGTALPIVVHGAALAERGRGAVLFGRPGAGKTTAAAVAHEADRLHDDMAVLRREAGRIIVRGAPFDPRGRRFERGQARLSVLCSLHHAEDIHLERGDARELVRRLLPETFLPLPLAGATRRGSFEALLAGVRALAEEVPYYRLHFRADRSFWPQLREVLVEATA